MQSNLLSADAKASESRIVPKSDINALAIKAEENAMLQAASETAAGQKRKFIAATG